MPKRRPPRTILVPIIAHLEPDTDKPFPSYIASIQFPTPMQPADPLECHGAVRDVVLQLAVDVAAQWTRAQLGVEYDVLAVVVDEDDP